MKQQFEFFQVVLVLSVREMFLSKAFLMSELDIYQILRLNYYTKLKKWWTDDVDGDCISFNLYRNTESSIILLKRWRNNFRKEECCLLISRSQLRLSGRPVKNKTLEEPMKLEFRLGTSF